MSDDTIYRQAAINALCDNCDHAQAGCAHYPCKQYVAVEKLPSAQTEYCLDEWCTECKEYDHERHCCPRFNHVIRTTLQEVKEEQVERKKGKWIDEKINSYASRTYCSECGNSAPFICVSGDYYGRNMHGELKKTKFCPSCGSPMEVEE